MNGGMRRQQGFTLIEVLVAITLLAIGILAAGSMQISSLGGNNLAFRVTQASTKAGDRIEQMMNSPYASLTDATGDGIAGLNDTITPATALVTDAGVTIEADGFADDGDGFTVFWNVVDNYPINDCKTIRVIVRRSDKGSMRTVAVDFIKMRPM